MLFVNPQFLIWRVRYDLGKTMVLPAFGIWMIMPGHWDVVAVSFAVWTLFIWHVLTERKF